MFSFIVLCILFSITGFFDAPSSLLCPRNHFLVSSCNRPRVCLAAPTRKTVVSHHTALRKTRFATRKNQSTKIDTRCKKIATARKHNAETVFRPKAPGIPPRPGPEHSPPPRQGRQAFRPGGPGIPRRLSASETRTICFYRSYSFATWRSQSDMNSSF